MKYFQSLLLIIGAIVASFIISNAYICVGPPATPLIIERFPAEVGNSWDYKRTCYVVICDTATGDTLEEHLIIDSLHTEFQDIDTLGDWECYRYFSQLFEEEGISSDTIWFAHPDTAFLEIAYTSSTHWGPLSKVTGKPRSKFGQRHFDSIEELKRFFDEIRNFGSSSAYSDTTFWSPPRKLFVFPLTVGTDWVAKIDDPAQEEREVAAEESVHVKAGDFLTLKLEITWSDLADFERYQWISDQGIIKDSVYLDSAFRTDEWGDIIGYVVSYDKYELLSGTTDVSLMDSENSKPGDFSLAQNYPNPFNPATSIQYTVGSRRIPIHTTLKVYDVLGRLTRTLVDEPETSGIHEIIWDGNDENGKEVASGIYFCRLTAGDFSETKKMLLLR